MPTQAPLYRHKRWRQRRENAQLSREQLATQAAIPVPKLYAIESGFEEPTPQEKAALDSVLNAANRARAIRQIEELSRSYSQGRTERALCLSQGYLTRLRSAAGHPSPALIAVLTLLANDPNRITELENPAAPSPTTQAPTHPNPASPQLRSPRPMEAP